MISYDNSSFIRHRFGWLFNPAVYPPLQANRCRKTITHSGSTAEKRKERAREGGVRGGEGGRWGKGRGKKKKKLRLSPTAFHVGLPSRTLGSPCR